MLRSKALSEAENCRDQIIEKDQGKTLKPETLPVSIQGCEQQKALFSERGRASMSKIGP
jgi:hypothetical protein